MRYVMVAGVATGGIGPRLLGAQSGTVTSAPVAQETGQFSGGGTIVWLRVADDGSVLAFAARGFRSAFAHPTTLTAEETERWADAAAAFAAADSAAQADRDPAGGRSGEDPIRVALGDRDLTVEQQTVGQAQALVVRFGARGPAPVTAVFPALGLQNVIPTLRHTAQVARAVTNARAAAAARAAAKATAAAAAAAAAAPPRDSGSPAHATPAPAAGAQPAGSPSSPSSSPGPASPAPSATAAPSGPAAAPVPAAPTAATPAHTAPPTTSAGQPGAKLASSTATVRPPPTAPPQPHATHASSTATDPTPSPSLVVPVARSADPPAPTLFSVKPTTAMLSPVAAPPSATAPAGSANAQIGHVTDAPDSRIEYATVSHAAEDKEPSIGSTDSSGGRPNASVAGARGGSASGSSSAALGAGNAARESDTAVARDSVAEKALNTNGRLPPSVLGDIIRQRQQLLQYCYTQFGLRADTALAGQIVVRLVIQQDGTVSDVTIPRHNWSGRGADHVEGCIRDRIQQWQFPAAQRASTHEIQLIFGR